MSKEMSEYALKPLLYQFNNLQNKFTLLCSIDFSFEEDQYSYKKSMNLSAFELFKNLDDDFEKVYYEIKKLERYLSDDSK